MAFNNHIP
jgi:hypothetical protein